MSYRQVLESAFKQRSARNPSYSQGAFARDLGIGAPQLNEILKGKKGLSPQSADRVAAALGLSDAERQRFCDMVESEHGRSRESRQRALARLAQQQNPQARPAPTEPAPEPRRHEATPGGLQGVWWVVRRETSQGPVPRGWEANEWTQLWTFEGSHFVLVSSRGRGVASRTEGTFELHGSLLLLHPDRDPRPGGSVERGPGLRHHIQWQPDGDLLLRTPGAAAPSALCAPGQELRSRLHRLAAPLRATAAKSSHSAAPLATGNVSL